MRESCQHFVEMIDGVYTMFDDPEMLSNVIRGIMIELKNNKQYMKLVVREDVRTWVRAMRENMGLAVVKKQEKKTSRGTGRSSKKAQDDDVMSAFADLGINFD